MKIAIYCRVNSKNQLSESFEEQEVKVKGFCKGLESILWEYYEKFGVDMTRYRGFHGSYTGN